MNTERKPPKGGPPDYPPGRPPRSLSNEDRARLATEQKTIIDESVGKVKDALERAQRSQARDLKKEFEESNQKLQQDLQSKLDTTNQQMQAIINQLALMTANNAQPAGQNAPTQPVVVAPIAQSTAQRADPKRFKIDIS